MHVERLAHARQVHHRLRHRIARSIAATGPWRVNASPRSKTRTPSRFVSSTRLLSLTPAKYKGSTPSTDRRRVTSSLI